MSDHRPSLRDLRNQASNWSLTFGRSRNKWSEDRTSTQWDGSMAHLGHKSTTNVAKWDGFFFRARQRRKKTHAPRTNQVYSRKELGAVITLVATGPVGATQGACSFNEAVGKVLLAGLTINCSSKQQKNHSQATQTHRQTKATRHKATRHIPWSTLRSCITPARCKSKYIS